MKKVIVIGLDGLERAIVEELLAAGQLPHFARLRAEGGFSRVATTTRPDTGGLVHVRHGHQPGRSRHFRFHPPRSADLFARSGPESL